MVSRSSPIVGSSRMTSSGACPPRSRPPERGGGQPEHEHDLAEGEAAQPLHLVEDDEDLGELHQPDQHLAGDVEGEGRAIRRSTTASTTAGAIRTTATGSRGTKIPKTRAPKTSGTAARDSNPQAARPRVARQPRQLQADRAGQVDGDVARAHPLGQLAPLEEHHDGEEDRELDHPKRC